MESNLYKKPKKWLIETYKGQSFNQNEKIVKPITIKLPECIEEYLYEPNKRIDKGEINGK